MGILADRIRVKATTFTGDMAPIEDVVIDTPQMEEMRQEYASGEEMVAEEKKKQPLSAFLEKIGLGIEYVGPKRGNVSFAIARYPDGHKALRVPKGTDIDDPKPIKKNLDKFKRLIDDDADVIVMTARSNAGLVRRALESLGVEMVGIRIIALGDPEASAKGKYISENLAAKYDTITLYDDRQDYLDAAKKAMKDKPTKFITVKAALVSDAEYFAAIEKGDMAKCQAMVDAAAKAAGYTIGPVYHGTPTSGFNKFDPKNRGGMGGAMGFWFASKQGAAEKFATQRFANAKPAVMSVYLRGDFFEWPSWSDYVSAVRSRNKGSLEDNMRSLRRHLISKGKDGGIIRNSETDGGGMRDDYIVFDNHNIKSADPVTRDDSGNIIPLSKRFNSASNDIRAMRADAVDAKRGFPTVEEMLDFMWDSDSIFYDLYPGYSSDGGNKFGEEYQYNSREAAEESARMAIGLLEGIPDPVDAWRSIRAENVDSIDKEYPGESWAFEKGAALEFGVHAGANYLLHAKIPWSAIDWEETVKRFASNSINALTSGDAEMEVVLNNPDAIRDLEIYQIKGMKKVARRVMAATTKKYQITYSDGHIEFKNMSPSFVDKVKNRDEVVCVEEVMPEQKVESAKGAYDLWGSIEKAVERGLLAYVGFMAADYLHQKKASFGLENYQSVIDAYNDIEDGDGLTDHSKSAIMSRLNDAGWDASEEGIEFLWNEIRRHRLAES